MTFGNSRAGDTSRRFDLALGLFHHQAQLEIDLRIGATFAEAVNELLNCQGRVIVAGMGKSGLVGKKIAATINSTGIASFFLHPAEAIHGDLGRVVEGDLLLAFSKSGETEELLVLLPHVKASAVPIVGVTQSADSTLGRHSDVVLELGPIDEPGPYGLAPTASTTRPPRPVSSRIATTDGSSSTMPWPRE